MNIGIIGTGAIAEAFLTGMLSAKGADHFQGNVLVSARTLTRSNRLVSKFQQVTSESDNQLIVDQSDTVMLSVLPNQLSSIVGELTFRADHTVISMIAGRSLASLADLVAPAKDVFRIIPMPPIEWGVGPIVLTPPNAILAKLFSTFGTPVEVSDEYQFSAFSASSAVMASFFEFVASQARWLESQGVPRPTATRYATSLIHSLAELTTHASDEALQELPEECLTVGGLNEQVLRESLAEGWFEKMDQRLDRIAARLEAAKKKDGV